MQRIEPAVSSRSKLAYFVAVEPGRGFLVWANLIADSMPPRNTSPRSGTLGMSAVVWEQNCVSFAAYSASG